VGNPEGQRPLGRPRRRWEINIKMDLRERECGGMESIDLAQLHELGPVPQRPPLGIPMNY
jgi:hypothetical protein